MKLLTARLIALLLGAATGGCALAAAWYAFFHFFSFILNAVNPVFNSVIFEVGRNGCLTVGLVAGVLAGGISGLFEIRRLYSALGIVAVSVTLSALILSDDAMTATAKELRWMLLTAVLYHGAAGAAVGLLVSMVNEFLGRSIFGGGYVDVYGTSRVSEDLISLEIDRARIVKRATPLPVPAEPEIPEIILDLAPLDNIEQRVPDKGLRLVSGASGPSSRRWAHETGKPAVSIDYQIADTPITSETLRDKAQSLLPERRRAPEPKGINIQIV